MGKSLSIHVVMVIIAVSIGFLYIQPTIEKIRNNQDTATVFKTEVAKVSEVNAKLAQKRASIDSISLQDKQRLITFMPDTLDEISIMRTLESILFEAGITPNVLVFEASNADNNTIDVSQPTTISAIIKTDFTVSESVLFNFMKLIQASAYPFILNEISITPTEESLLSVKASYQVNALNITQITQGEETDEVPSVEDEIF